MRKFSINHYGLTVTEMIFVLVFLTLLLSIVLPIIDNTLDNQKDSLYEIQIDNIKTGASAWGGQNICLMPSSNGDSVSVSLGELKSKGFVDKDIINPKTEQEFPDNMLVTILMKNGTYIYNVNASVIDQASYDPEAPFIVLNGQATEYIEIGSEYVEKGAQARDKEDNIITTIGISIKQNDESVTDILTDTLNTYIVTYTAVDTANNKSSSVNRNVIVHDTIAPVLTVNNYNRNYNVTVSLNSSFTTPPANVTDNSGEILNYTINGNVDTSKPGTYQLVYEAKDSSNNIGRLLLNVIVKDIVE